MTTLLVLCAAAPLALGCGAELRQFSRRTVLWTDPDLTPARRPAARVSTPTWDAAEGTLFRPALGALSLRQGVEAVDVNALDEVPRSSWFENRIGLRAMTPSEVARGACTEAELDPPRPWTVVEVKADGVQPGFIIEDARGHRYLMKTDGVGRSERSTAADTIGAALLHAAGYHTPCNRVVFFERGDLRFDASSESEVERALAAAGVTPSGALRASLSAMVDDTLGPWRYEGRYEADPNDRVPHQLRREVRALRWFFAWIDHVDAREHNTLMAWQGEERGHVRHLLIDFGDSLGAEVEDPRRSVRIGRTGWMDPTAVVEDLVTFGLLARPWYADRADEPVISDLGTEPFDPDGWRANYDAGAFALADETDAAWAARIIARFTPEHVRALAELGRFSSPRTTRALVRALLRRRRLILRRHLSRRSPLTQPVVRETDLCLEDRAVTSGVFSSDRPVQARLRFPEVRSLETRRRGATVCAPAPAYPYAVVDLTVADAWPARVHLRAGQVVGLERPATSEFP